MSRFPAQGSIGNFFAFVLKVGGLRTVGFEPQSAVGWLILASRVFAQQIGCYTHIEGARLTSEKAVGAFLHCNFDRHAMIYRTDHYLYIEGNLRRFISYDAADRAAQARSFGRQAIFGRLSVSALSLEYAAGFTIDVPGVSDPRAPSERPIDSR